LCYSLVVVREQQFSLKTQNRWPPAVTYEGGAEDRRLLFSIAKVRAHACVYNNNNSSDNNNNNNDSNNSNNINNKNNNSNATTTAAAISATVAS
jgi:hypothetical protein